LGNNWRIFGFERKGKQPTYEKWAAVLPVIYLMLPIVSLQSWNF
jgi:hypothetical protein